MGDILDLYGMIIALDKKCQELEQRITSMENKNEQNNKQYPRVSSPRS